MSGEELEEEAQGDTPSEMDDSGEGGGSYWPLRRGRRLGYRLGTGVRG